jgi:gliding motility-associated-like protein
VTALSPEGCTVKDTATVNVIDVNVITDDNDTICKGFTVTLNAQTNASNYYWYPSIGLSDSTILNPVASALQTTTYHLVGYTGACRDSDQVVVHPVPSPILFAGDSITIISGQSYTINATSDNAVSWTPAYNITCNDCVNPVVSPDSSTWYYVTSTNEFGCMVNDSVLVRVNRIAAIYVPNCFTPSGDGHNERFIPRGINIEELHMVIYDRWGNLIFETNDIDKGWDGKFKGTLVQEDVYVYMIEATDVHQKQYRLNGSVTVLK